MNDWTETFFVPVLVASRDAAILALTIGGILAVLGQNLPPVWRHLMWMLVALRLLLPVLPSSPMSWQVLIPKTATTPLPEEEIPSVAPVKTSGPVSEPQFAPPTAPSFAMFESPPPPLSPPSDPAPHPWRLLDWLACLWVVGTFSMLLTTTLLLFRFQRRLGLLTISNHPGEADAMRILTELAQECGFPTAPVLRITDAVTAPALTGLGKPMILLPPRSLEKLDDEALRFVLLHELAHLRRRDLWTNWVLALLRALHWFNPVVWWAFHRLRVEAERATDAWVLERSGADATTRYGEALLGLLEIDPSRPTRLPGVVGVLESSRDLRSRIGAIARFTGKRSGFAVAGAALLLTGIAVVGLTQAPEGKGGKDLAAHVDEQSPLPEEIDSPITRVSDVEITVVDKAGNPVEGADMIVMPGNDYLAQILTPVSLRGRTDTKGELRGRTAPVREDSHFGHLYVMAFKKGFAGYTWIQPKPDPVAGTLHFAGNTLQTRLRLSPTGTVQARIVRPDSSPAKGLRFWVDAIGLSRTTERFTPFGNPPRLPHGLWQAVTDENGTLKIEGIPEGARVHLGHDQKEWGALPGFHRYKGDGLTTSGEMRTFTLAPAASISGRVVSPNGKGVPNITVEILEHTPYVNSYHGYAISDADGFYQLNSIPEGHYKLFAKGRGGHNQHFWVLDGGGDFELKAGESISNQNFEFKKGGRLVRRLVDEAGVLITESYATVGLAGPVKDVYHSGLTPAGYHENRQMYESEFRTGEITYLDIPFRKRTPSEQISGVVIDAAGTPVSGAKVKCPSIQSPFIERMMTETDEAGRFALDLPPDTKEVTLIAWSGDQISNTTVKYKSGTEVTVSLLENQFGTVVGRVIDGDGNPLKEAKFFSTGQELPGLTERSIETNRDGRFRIAVLPEKLVTFWISKDGYTKVASQGKIEAGVETDLGDIQIEVANAFVAGQVIYANGDPVARATLGIGGKDQPDLEDIVADAEGRFRIQGVAEGWLTVEAYDHAEEGNQSGKTRVRSGSEDVRVVLKPTQAWKVDPIVDFIGKPAPPLNVDHWYHVSNPDPDHKGNIRMIRFICKDRPLIFLSNTVKLMQDLQNEFEGKGVEFILVHGPWPKEEVEEILKAEHPDLTVALAIESEANAMSDAFGVQTWLTIVIDREGKVVFQNHTGKGSKTAVQKLLDAEKAASQPTSRDEVATPADAAPNAELVIRTIGRASGTPISGAAITLKGKPTGSAETWTQTKSTDEKGEASFTLPEHLARARAEVQKTGLTSHFGWALPGRPFTFQIDPAVVIGGKIIDPTGTPVAGAKVEVSWHAIQAGVPREEYQWSIHDPKQPILTDSDGSWSYGLGPEDFSLLDQNGNESHDSPHALRLKVHHPEFSTTNLREGPEGWRKRLLSGAAEIVLVPDYKVSGRVLDLNGNPLRGVSIRELTELGQNEKEVTSGEGGQFSIYLKPGTSRLLVENDGYGSEIIKTTVVRSEVTQINDLSLAASKPLRIRIVDDAGTPVPGFTFLADLVSPDSSSRLSLHQFETDEKGETLWASPPSSGIQWNFTCFKSGYFAKRDQRPEIEPPLSPAFRWGGAEGMKKQIHQ